MKRSDGIIRRIADAADLSGEALPKVPLIEVMGHDRVLVENHCGITAYSDEAICVKVKFGSVQITGCHLTIARMTVEQLIIVGEIRCVELYRGR